MFPQSSFCQRLLLLVIDKIIIGSLIALAFVIYDRWKTEDTRQYNEVRRQVDLEFTQNEHVRSFLPVVLDSSEHSFVRLESLAALVDTQSISSDTTMRLAQTLILDGILDATTINVTPFSVLNEDFGTTLRRTPYRGPEIDVLAELIDNAMPEGLATVLSSYERLGLELDTLVPNRQPCEADGQRRRLMDAQQFWVRVFLDSAARTDGSGFAALDTPELQVRNLRVLDDLAKCVADSEAQRWFAKSGRVIRTVGALGLAGVNGGSPAAVAYLSRFMTPSSSPAALRFSAEVVDVLRRRNINSSDLLDAALDFAVASRQMALASDPTALTAASARRRLLQEISDYLYFAVTDSAAAEILLPRVGEEVRAFVATSAAISLDDVASRDQYRVDRVMVRVLSNLGRSRVADVGREAREILGALYAIGPKKLVEMGLADFVQDWERERGL